MPRHSPGPRRFGSEPVAGCRQPRSWARRASGPRQAQARCSETPGERGFQVTLDCAACRPC